MRERKKLMITGGHVTPALAVIDALTQENKDVEVVFVGRKYVNKRETAYSFEYSEVIKRGIPFVHLDAGRMTRIATIHSFLNLMRIPLGFLNAYKIVEQQKPDIVLTFGGYLGLPIALAARLKRIPVFSHEQTLHPGAANRFIASLAKKIFVSFPESAHYFDKKKVVISGNPLRTSIFKKVKTLFQVPNLPCIYVTGGSLGAHSVNTHIERLLPELLKSFVVIHQTGNVSEFRDYERLCALKSSLPPDKSPRYFIQEHFLDDEIGWVYATADLVVGRSGANTFFELMSLKKPAVFIPLPWSAHDEQRKQASIFKDHGLGEIFEQNRSSAELFELIEEVAHNLEHYKKNFETISSQYKEHAEQTIIQTIFQE